MSEEQREKEKTKRGRVEKKRKRRTGCKSNQKAIDHSPDTCATIAPVETSCQPESCFTSQEPQVDKIGDYFFQHNKIYKVGMKLPDQYRFYFSVFCDLNM